VCAVHAERLRHELTDRPCLGRKGRGQLAAGHLLESSAAMPETQAGR
jgi:hypothetical protein